MSVSTPKIEAIRLVAAKIEATTGTEETLAAADASLIFYNPTLTPDDPANDTQLAAAQGQNVSVPGLQTGTLTGDVDLAGSGAAGTSPAWALAFLAACDMVETAGTWAVGRTGVTLTIAMYEDGLKRVLYGARGSFKIVYNDGQPVKISFEMKGKYKEDADAAILAPTFPAVVPPIFGSDGTTVTIASYSPICSTFNIDLGADVQMREDANAADGTGLLSAVIVNKKPTWSMECEAEPTSARDWRGIVSAKTQEDLSLVIGGTAGNIVTLAASGTMQTTKAGRGSRNGLLTRTPSGIFTSAAPFSIAFG